MAYSASSGAIIRIGVDGAAASRREIDTVARTMSNLSTTVQNAMRNLAASVGIGAGLAQTIQMTDEYAKFTAQLRLATQSQREYGAAYADVKRIANDAQQGLAQTGVLYARIANGTRELGTTQQQVAAITETVNLALKVSNATTEEAASAQLQLSQAFASGTLRGEEFNAVNEAAPRLMLALADGIGVPVGALKKMAENGLITSQVMADVLPKALEGLREEAKQVQTISGAFTVLKNNMMEVFALKAQSNGTVALLTNGIGLLANNLDLVTAATGGLLAMKVANYFFAGVAAVQAYMAKNAELAALVVAERAALVARAEAQVASTGATLVATGATLAETEATLAGLVAQRATIIALRESAVAQLAIARANIASAEAAMAAASAAGVQSFALRTLRLATAELAAAEQARAAAMAEITALGVAQTRVSAQITAATAAQTAAAAANATATTAQAAAVAGAAGATGRTAVTAGLATRALGLLGGPIGIITTLLGVGAAAWMLWGNKGSEAEKKVTSTLAEEIDDYLANLQKQIDKLKERNELASKGMTTATPPVTDGEKKRDQILAEINRVSKQTDLNIDAKTEILRVWGARLNAVTQNMEQFAAAQQKNKDLAFATKYDEWLGKNGTAAQKIKYELEELRKEYGRVTPEMEKFVRDKYADKGAAQAIKHEATAYQNLTTSISEKIDQNRMELATSDAVTESQKLQIKLAQELASGKLKLSAAHLSTVQTLLSELAATEALGRAQQAEKDGMEWMQQSAQARNASTAALQTEYALYGKSADARDIAMVAVKAEADLEAYLTTERRKGIEIGEQLEAQLRAEKDMRIEVEQATLAQSKGLGYANQLAEENKRAAAQSISDPRAREQALLAIDADIWRERIRLAGDGTEAQKKLQQEFDTWYATRSKAALVSVDLTQATTMLDALTALDEATQSAAQGMASSFGQVGSAIGGLTTALSGYGRTQAAIAAQLAAATKDAGGDQTKIQRANMMAAQASAQAQVRSYGDMASAAKGFFKENTAGYKVMQGAEKAFRAYEMAMSVKSMVEKSGLLTAFTGLFVASKATETAAEGTSTAASTAMAGTQASAWGVTAVVKAIASLPFPLNLAAGAATLAAVVAVGAKIAGSISGGGGSGAAVNLNSAEERQKVQGTGTVLGDPAAKSASIANSLEIMKKNSELELGYQNSMLTALQNIATALGGAAKGLLQTTGITGGSAFGTVASSNNSLIGASHTKDITDSGVQFSGTFGQLRAGAGMGRQYEDVYTTSDGGAFRSGWSRTDTNYKNLSAEAMKPFALIFDNMGDLLVDAGTKLGRDNTSLVTAINSIGVDFEVSLRGLTGQALTDALNAGVSVAFDKVTTQLFPTIQTFQKMGEGLGETLVRVATDVQAVDTVFASMGKSTKYLSANIENGWLGIIKTVYTGIGEMTIEAKERLVEASGGLDKFVASAKSFMQNFYSEAEQLEAKKAKLAPVLAQYGLTTEGENAQKMFRDFVLGINTTTAAGAESYATLMSIEQDFFDATNKAASERKDLQDQLDELTMTPAQLQEKALLAYDPSNRALARQVQLQKDLKNSTGGAGDALKDIVDRMSATRDSVQSFKDSLLMGTLSTLTPMEKYLEAQRQYGDALSKAKANPGDSAAVSAAQSAATAFLTASQVINASSAAYLGDKSKVISDINQLAAIADAQMTDAQRQLSALDKQVAGIAQLNDTASVIAAAIANQSAPAPVAPPAFDVQRYAAGSGAAADVLVTEVKGLRAENAEIRKTLDATLVELKQLRTDANRNAGDLQDATENMGEVVAGSVGTAMEQAAYQARNPTRVPPR